MIKAFLIVGALLAVFIFYPKEIGSPLCGPVCPPTGPQYWEQSCLGVTIRKNFIDSYSNRCFGIPVGERACYGILEEGASPEQISCNF
jgi:hypothetical protein